MEKNLYLKGEINLRSKIESIIKDERVSNPLLGYYSPISSIHVDGWTWILFSSRGFSTKIKAQKGIDEVDADPSSSIGVPRVIVSWKAPNRQTAKYYVYYRWKRDVE